MCDTFVLPTDVGVLLAENSGRDPGEAQLWERTATAGRRPGERTRPTWVDLPQVTRTHATVLSRPEGLALGCGAPRCAPTSASSCRATHPRLAHHDSYLVAS